MFSYFAYGLCIHSDLKLPRFPSGEGLPDVIVRFAKHEDFSRQDYGRRSFLSSTHNEVVLSQKGMGGFRVRGGREIIAYPLPKDNQQRLIALLVRGAALNILLHQRGLLVLHASAVSVNGSAVVFIGYPGAGKSTTAGALYTRGHTFVSDDFVPVQIDGGTPTVFPAYPAVNLHPRVVDYIGFEVDGNRRLGKHTVSTLHGFSKTPLPLRCVYVLFEGRTQRIEPIPPKRSLLYLMQHSGIHTVRGGFRILKETNTFAFNFKQCSKLASCIPVYRLERGRSLSGISELAKLVEEHLTRNTEPRRV